MKLSNQNIYNLRGCKNFWRRCQMPLGGVQIISGGVRTPPHHPRKSVPGLNHATRSCYIYFHLFPVFHTLYLDENEPPAIQNS